MSITINITALHDALSEFGGFTFDPESGRLLQAGTDHGYVVALPGTERVLGFNLTERAVTAAVLDALANLHTDYGDAVYVGGWFSPERGYLIELSTIHHVDRSAAVLLGELRDQDAIFDLSTGHEIPIPRVVFV